MAKKKADKQPDDILSPIEHLVMKAVIQLGEKRAYGVEILELIKNSYHGIHAGSVYNSLERLTFKRYIEGRLGEAEPTRGGRSKKFYRITAQGKEVLDFTHDLLLSPLAQEA